MATRIAPSSLPLLSLAPSCCFSSMCSTEVVILLIIAVLELPRSAAPPASHHHHHRHHHCSCCYSYSFFDPSFTHPSKHCRRKRDHPCGGIVIHCRLAGPVLLPTRSLAFARIKHHKLCCLFASTQRGKLIPADTTATCESTLLSSAACDERLRAA